MKIVKDVWEILDSRSKLTIVILQFFLIGSSLLETLSIIILAPFMGLISGELKVEESKFLNFLFELSNVNYDQFIFYFGIFVLIFFYYLI